MLVYLYCNIFISVSKYYNKCLATINIVYHIERMVRGRILRQPYVSFKLKMSNRKDHKETLVSFKFLVRKKKHANKKKLK